MGVKGIGIATIIAQSVSLIIILIKVLKNKRIKKINKNYLFPKLIFLKNILANISCEISFFKNISYMGCLYDIYIDFSLGSAPNIHNFCMVA